MPNWFRQGNGSSNDPDDNQGEFKPDEFKKELSTEFKTQLDALKAENETKLAPIIEMANNFKAAQEEAARQRQVQQNKQHQDDNAVDDDLWITNPAEAHRRSTLALKNQTAGIAAITMRREILSDMEYYTGPLKDEIDQLIEAQSLEHRANPGVLKNAYYTVVGKHAAEIQEGKYKKQLNAATFSGNGTGAPGSKTSEETEELSDDEKYAAKKFGFTEADWNKSKQELGYV